MATYDAVATRWAQRVVGITTKQNLTNERMPVYGGHHPQRTARTSRWPCRSATGRASSRLPASTATASRTPRRSTSRSSVAGASSSPRPAAVVTIPFSALEAASIIKAARPSHRGHVRLERDVDREHHEQPAGTEWSTSSTPCPAPAATSAGRGVHRVPRGVRPGLRRPPEPPRSRCPGWRRTPGASASSPVPVGTPAGTSSTTATAACSTRPSRNRHWLGESLVTGNVATATRTVLALPGQGPARGRHPRPSRRRARPAHRVRGATRRPSPPWPVVQRLPAEPGSTPKHGARTAYFLSGFDSNETRPSYFFCELPPKVKPTTVAEAYDTLKPTAVRLAEEYGRDVKRQGDIFAVPVPAWTSAAS